MAGNINLGTIEAVLKASGFDQFNKDLNRADSQLKTFGKSLTKAGDAMVRTGRTLTTSVTLPIVAAGTAALNLAADFEVASRKFSTAFADSGDSAADAVENLSENFGLAESQATSLLAFTGDILRGFGATGDEALELSEDVNELAAALSAYNGVPVAETSRSITSALTGERESLKQLGVVIRDTDVQQRLLENGQQDLTGQSLLLAQAQATLELAMEQSGDAVSSFSGNQDTLSFQTQALVGDVKDLAVEFGEILLPIAKDLVAEIREMTDRFSTLDDEQKEAIVRNIGLVAAIGPLVSGIGAVTRAVGTLSTAMSFLAANPIVLAITGVTALGVAIGLMVRKAREERIDELTDQFGDLAEATGVTEESMRVFVQGAGLVEEALRRNDMFVTFESVNEQVIAITKNTSLTREQIIQIGLESEHLSDVFKEQLEIMDENRRMSEGLSNELAAQETLMIHQAAAAAEATRAAEERRAEEARITEELAQQEEIRLRVEERYLAIREEVVDILNSEKSEYEQIQEQIDRLQANPWAAGRLENERLQALEVLRARQQEIVDEETSSAQAQINREIRMARDAANAVYQIEQQALNNVAQLSDNREYLLEQEYMARIAAAEEAGASTLAIEREFELKRDELREERLEAERAASEEQIDIIKDQYKAIEDIALDFADSFSQIQDLEAQLAKQRTDEFLHLNQAEIDALKEKAKTDEGLTEEEAKRLESLTAEKKNLLDKQYKQEVEAFKTQKAIRIGQAIITGAQAAINAFNALVGIPFVGPFLAAAAAAATAGFTAVQVNLMRKEKPPSPPKLAKGGIVNNPGPGVNAIIGEAGPEAVLPLTDKTFNSLGEAITESQQGTVVNKSGDMQSLTVVVEGLGQVVIDNVQDRLNNNIIRVPASSIVSGA